MADKEVEETTNQESPTDEQKQPEEVSETAEKPVQTPETETEAPEEKNWKAIREELDALKAENKALKGEDQPPLENIVTTSDRIYLTQEENAELSKDEIKAEIRYPELEESNLFSRAVAGEYRIALDKYNLSKSLGRNIELPKVTVIAARLKKEIERTYGDIQKTAEIVGAKKQQESLQKKEATVDIESRSDRAKADVNADLPRLRRKTQEGDMGSVVTRLTGSKL